MVLKKQIHYLGCQNEEKTQKKLNKQRKTTEKKTEKKTTQKSVGILYTLLGGGVY